LGNKPGVHALLVGVSDYTYLPDDDQPPTSDDFQLRKLHSGAVTAHKIYEWLIKRKDHLAIPLATCRLLLAPSTREEKLEEFRTPCGVNDFLAAANDWREDALTNRDNAAVFYFAGLGKELPRAEPVILLQDFNNKVGPVLRSAVGVNNLVYGLSPTVWQENIARTQLFFFDTSRTQLPDKQPYQLANATKVFDAQVVTQDDRAVAVFYAARPGMRAFARKGEQTLFSKVLLQCLDHDAAVPGDVDDYGTAARWEVTIHSLIEALQQGLQALNEENRKYGIEQDFMVNGRVQDAVLHYLDQPPQVDVRLEVDPPKTDSQITLELVDDHDTVFPTRQDPANPNVFTQTVPGGYYSLRVRVKEAGGRDFEQKVRTRLIKPPRTVWKVRVSAEPDRGS
jgi:hypothetical protein